MLKLKINTGKAASSQAPTQTNPSAPAPAPPTPASAGSGIIKLKLGSQPPTPATEQPSDAPASTGAKKAGANKRKPTGGKIGGGRKRAAGDDISPAPKRPTGGVGLGRRLSIKPPVAPQSDAGVPHSAGSLNKLKLTQRKPSAPKIRQLTVKRPPPPRLPGHGYDSEDSDAEKDPAIQQGFILRMQPGEDCEYLREAIANGKIGLPPSEGPAEVWMRFLDKDCRRAVVTIRSRKYAAALVDLPCVVESMKSWDKKGWWKVADVCQMLLVLGRCTNDEEARSFPLPREVDKSSLQYAHGLTPPMHWVRKRRFRKRLSYKTIANVEEEVERLLKEDELVEQGGGEVLNEILDRAGEREFSQDPESSQYDDEADAEGEAVDSVENGERYEDAYNDEEVDEEGEATLAGLMQAEFDADATDATDTPAIAEVVTESPAPLVDQAASFSAVENALAEESAPGTPIEGQVMTPQDEQSSDEDESDYDDDEDSPDVMDEDAVAAAAERNQQLEEVADLEREVVNQKRKVENTKNQLLKERAVAQLRTLEEELRVKRGVFGLEAED